MKDHNKAVLKSELAEAFMAIVQSKFPEIEPSSRDFETIMGAAEKLVNSFGIDSEKAYPEMGINAWLQTDDVGMSSKYLVRVATSNHFCSGAEPSYPLDIGDFSRCVKVLESDSLVRTGFHLVADESSEWEVLYHNWDDLSRSLDEECPDWRNGHLQAPEVSKKFRDLLDSVRPKRAMQRL